MRIFLFFGWMFLENKMKTQETMVNKAPVE